MFILPLDEEGENGNYNQNINEKLPIGSVVHLIQEDKLFFRLERFVIPEGLIKVEEKALNFKRLK